MNPRPRKSCIKRLRAFPVRWFSTATLETGKKRRLSPIDFGFRLRTEALDLLLQSDVLNPRAGPAGQNGYLETRRRMQTACYWQFCFPIVLRELGTRHDFLHKMQSRRIRCAPLPSSVYHRMRSALTESCVFRIRVAEPAFCKPAHTANRAARLPWPHPEKQASVCDLSHRPAMATGRRWLVANSSPARQPRLITWLQSCPLFPPTAQREGRDNWP